MRKVKKRIYRPVPRYSVERVRKAVAGGDLAVLRSAAFAVPWHWKDREAAQEFCLHLTNHRDAVVRGNALLGLSYLARFHQRLDKDLGRLALLRGLRDPERSVRQRAKDAIADVNYLMRWKIGQERKRKR